MRAAADRWLRGRPTKKACSRIDSFPKLESYDLFKEARWINSRVDDFKAYSGRFFKAAEEEVYKHPSFIKHTPVKDRPARIKALRGAGYHFYENDYKAFESHFTREIMDACELQLYRYLFSQYPDDARFICEVISGQNRLHTRVGVSVEVEARRMSGDMCTSLGNGFTNLMIFEFLKHEKNAEGDAIVEGDDGLFRITEPLQAEDFKDLGFTVEIHELRDPCEGHFCGMSISPDGWCVKDPRRVFKTFGWTSSYMDGGNYLMDELLRGKALCLAYEMPQCPIIGELARVGIELTQGVVVKRFVRKWGIEPEEYLGFVPDKFAPTSATRQFFAEKFGISIECQLAVESLIRDCQFDRIQELIPPTPDELLYSMRFVEVA